MLMSQAAIASMVQKERVGMASKFETISNARQAF